MARGRSAFWRFVAAIAPSYQRDPQPARNLADEWDQLALDLARVHSRRRLTPTEQGPQPDRRPAIE